MVSFKKLAAIVFLCGVAGPCFGQQIVAHRGASHDAPENTLAAFRLAWQQQADAIEGDFYLTRDQQIVCIHDKSTRRTAPGQPELKIADATLQQLRSLDVGRWKHARYAGETIPTLAEVLSTVPKDKQIFVEIKCGPEILPVLKEQLKQSELEPNQIVIICFDQQVVKGARAQMPEYKVNWLTSLKRNKLTRNWTPAVGDVVKTLKETGATGLGINGNSEGVGDDFVKTIQDAGSEFHVWTINKADVARRYSRLGARSITTDKPAEIRRLIK